MVSPTFLLSLAFLIVPAASQDDSTHGYMRKGNFRRHRKPRIKINIDLLGRQSVVTNQSTPEEPAVLDEPDTTDATNECPSGNGITYIGTSTEICSTIRFFCQDGLQYFSAGDCGCGCEPDDLAAQSTTDSAVQDKPDALPELDEPDAQCPSGPFVDYKATNGDDCARIRFFCDEGFEYFFASDECGCGCKPVACLFGGDACPSGLPCTDDSDDACDPTRGDANCPGLCLPSSE